MVQFKVKWLLRILDVASFFFSFFVFTFQGFIDICVNFDQGFLAHHVGQVEVVLEKICGTRNVYLIITVETEKSFSENDIVFIEEENNHSASEHALKGNCDDSELTSTIPGMDVIDMGDM